MDPRDPIETHIQIVWSFVRLVAVKRAMHEAIPTETKIDFWRIIQGASLDLALIEWCKVFGATKDQTHWTHLVAEKQHDSFRDGLYAAVGMTDSEWKAYWKLLKDYRNELAAHHDMNAASTHYPGFDAALEAAFYYHNSFLYPAWLKKHPDTKYPPDMKAYAGKYYDDHIVGIAKVAVAATKPFEPK